MAIRGKHLERDCSIVTTCLQLPHRSADVHRSGTERQMQVGGTSFVIVQMHVAEPASIRTEDLLDRAVDHHEIGVPDVQMKSELREWLEQLTELAGGVEVTGEIFHHQAEATLARIGQKLTHGCDIALNEEAAVVHGGVPVGMHIHPARANRGEDVDAAAQLLHRGAPDLFDSTGNRQVEGGMTNHAELVLLERA